MARRSIARLVLLGSLTAIALGSIPSSARAATPAPSVQAAEVVTVVYHGVAIEPTLASRHFCHTRDYPVVRCFDSQAEVDADLGVVEPQAAGVPGPGASVMTSVAAASWPANTAYAIVYWDINYGGTALTAYDNFPNLAALGWNDQISSFKSVNCAAPRFWEHAYYAGNYWQSSCNAWVPNLYAFNDTISSIQNTSA